MMEQAIRQYKAGEITFDEFNRRTKKYWNTVADGFLIKWDHPSAVERDDLVQEMLLGAWFGLEALDFSKTEHPEVFISFSATSSARRWFHRQRGANRFASNVRDKDGNSLPQGRWHYSESLLGDIDLSALMPAWNDDVVDQYEVVDAAIDFQQRLNSACERVVAAVVFNQKSREEAYLQLAKKRRRKLMRKGTLRQKAARKRGQVGADLKVAKSEYWQQLNTFFELMVNVDHKNNGCNTRVTT